MMLRKLRMSITTLSALSLMAAGVLTVSTSAPAMAAQTVNTPVTLEHDTADNAITLTGDNGAPELVCVAKTPQDSYEVGYKFTMRIADLKAKWKSAVDTWRTQPHLAVDDLDTLGEFTLKATLPADVEVTDASYTTDSYARAFAAANANSSLLKIVKVHDVQVIDKVLSVHLVMDSTRLAQVNTAFAGADTIVFPTLDNTLYVSAANVEKHAGANSAIEVTTAKVTGLVDVPETRNLFAHLAEKAPLNVSGDAQGSLALSAKMKPYIEIVHKAKDTASSPALPAEISALNTTVERSAGEDPDALPAAPEAGKRKLDVEGGTWTFEEYRSEKAGMCGKRLVTGVWSWTSKGTNNQPGDQPQSNPPQNPGGNTSDPAPQAQPTVTTSVPRLVAGKDITFRAEGFLPESQVTFKVHSDEVLVGTVQADAKGVATIKWNVPMNFTPGKHKVVAFSGATHRAESAFIVDAPAQAQNQAPKGKPSLAVTGGATEILVLISAMASAMGALAYGRSTRRRG